MTADPHQKLLRNTISRLANNRGRSSEFSIQSDIKILLELSDLFTSVEGEVQVGNGDRIDIQADQFIIEVKRDLRRTDAATKAAHQVARYVAAKQRDHGRVFLGIVTDGAYWHAAHWSGPGDSSYRDLGSFTLRAGDTVGMIRWLQKLTERQKTLKLKSTDDNRPSLPESSKPTSTGAGKDILGYPAGEWIAALVIIVIIFALLAIAL